MRYSFLCVYNDKEVFSNYFKRAFEDLDFNKEQCQLITIDNTTNKFQSARNAISHMVGQSKGELVIVCHQDIWFEPDFLNRMEHYLEGQTKLGVFGCAGVDADSVFHGFLKQGTIVLGHPRSKSIEVDSVDECIFGASREFFNKTEFLPIPGWHTYAVEMCIRASEMGLVNMVAPVYLEHYSAETNRKGLFRSYADLSQKINLTKRVNTTCGPVFRKRSIGADLIPVQKLEPLVRSLYSRVAGYIRGVIFKFRPEFLKGQLNLSTLLLFIEKQIDANSIGQFIHVVDKEVQTSTQRSQALADVKRKDLSVEHHFVKRISVESLNNFGDFVVIDAPADAFVPDVEKFNRWPLGARCLYWRINKDRLNLPDERVSKYDIGHINTSPFEIHMRVLKTIGTGKKVLEIGCSTGYFSRALKKNRNWVFGVEVDPEAAVVSKTICDDFFEGPLENLDVEKLLSEVSFDYIVMTDVLEHIEDIDLILKRLFSLMSESTQLLLCVPNIAHFTSRISLAIGNFEYSEYGLMDYDHIRFFTKQSIRKFVVRNNLVCTKISGIPSSWIYSSIPSRILRKTGILNILTAAAAWVWPSLFGYQLYIKVNR